MGFSDEMTKELEKLIKKKQQKIDGLNVGSASVGQNSSVDDDDIAPVNNDRGGGRSGSFRGGGSFAKDEAYEKAKTALNNKFKPKNTKGSWFKSGAFSDGFDWSDIPAVILGTGTDLIEELAEGVMEIPEAVIDAGAYLVGGAGKLFGADGFANKTKKFIADDLYNAEKLIKAGTSGSMSNRLLGWMGTDTEAASLLGDKAEGLANSAGQLVAQIGLNAVGVPWWITSGVTTFGGEVEHAFQKGAGYGEAGISGLVSAGAELLTEKLFGGSGLGEKGWINVDKFTKGVSNKAIKALLDFGIDVAGEGGEEAVSELLSTLGQQLTYERKETWAELLTNEDAMDAYLHQVGKSLFGKEAREAYGDAFIGGSLLGGGANLGKVSGSLKNKTDYRSGLTANEQSVFDEEYNNRIAEQEKKGGKKLSGKDKSKIYDEVMEDLEKGKISTDTIEKVLGGDTYKSYQDAVKNEDAAIKPLLDEAKSVNDEFKALNQMKIGERTGEQTDRLEALRARKAELETQIKNTKKTTERDFLQKKYKNEAYELAKGTKLEESYNERTRRGQAFAADVTKYKGKQRAIVQKAIDSGILNNTNKTHDFVDFIAKSSEATGVDFDFLNNQKLKESGFAVDGVFVNGYFDSKTKTVGINLNSAKALNTVVGHEITHVLEGTKLYSELQKAVTEYAKTKGEYQSRYDALAELYKNIENADIDAELTADLVGDYLFTDADFVNNLSANHRNVFQKIYDEVKYLCKIATAGSKEARQLEKVKKTFEDAFRAETKNTARGGGVKYSLNAFEDGKKFVDVNIDQAQFDGLSIVEMNNQAKRIIKNKYAGKVVGIDNRLFVNGNSAEKYVYYPHGTDESIVEAKARASTELDNLIDAGTNFRTAADGADGHVHPDAIGGFSYFDTLFKVGDQYYRGTINIKNISKGKLFYGVTKVENITQDIHDSYGENPTAIFLRDASMNSISQNSEKSTENTKKSLSAQNDDLGPIGDYNVYGKEVALEGPLPDDLAQIGENTSDAGFTGEYTGRHYNTKQTELLSALPVEALQNAVDANGNLSFNVIGLGGDAAAQQAWKDAGLTYEEDGRVYVDENAVLDERDRRRKANSQTSVDSENGNVNRVDTEGATALSTESTTDNRALVTQKDINKYVEDSYVKGNDKDYIKYAKADVKLVQAVSDEIDISGYMHALRDNDIRHIRNSHGERTNEKYPVTKDDIKMIPDIVQNYDKVLVANKGNNKGIVYVKVSSNGLVYYLEQVTSKYGNEKLLINKQMIKTGIEDIPDISGIKDAIAKKQTESEFLADLKVRQVYAQSVYHDQSVSKHSISETQANVNRDSKNNMPSVRELYEQKLSNHKNALNALETDKSNSLSSFDEAIRKKLVEYNGLEDKNTKRANTLLQQIENLRLRRDNVQADYANRIAKQQARIEAFESKSFEEFENETLAVRRSELQGKTVESIKDKFNENGLDLDDVLKHAKDLSTFSTVDNTPQRVMEKSLGYKEGGILADLTVNKVAQNETEGIKWLNGITDRKNGLLSQLVKDYGIKPGSKASAAAQMYAEGFYVDKNGDIIQYGDVELKADFPDSTVRENIKKLAKDERVRQFYDETLDAINESRRRNGYPEIQKLDNYFLHFRAMEDTFSRLGLPFNPNDIRAKDLPTDLNGVTADLKPGQPYFASSKHREGKRTSFDLLGGLEKYATSAKNQIYHIDDIQTLRALRNYIADTYGQAKGLENLDTLTEEEVQEKIKEVYGSHLSTFAKFLNEEANVLAGKTALIDRGLEGVIGRRAMSFMDTVNRQVGSNMVGYNVSSALTNLIAPVQAFAKTNKADFIKGFAQTVSNRLKAIKGNGDTFAEESPVCVRRKGTDRFHRTAWQKVSDPGYALMSAVDNFSTEIIARAKHNELTRKGMDSETAHVETDKWVSRLMGDRSLGQMPQIYNSKMLGLVTKFQLEVRNQLDSQFYDTIQEAKASTADIENALERNAKKAAKIGSTFFTLAVGQHLFGKAFEAVAGYNPAFDIISVLIKALGLDDDEESEDTVLDNIEQGFFELMDDMPYTSILEGGRIPISSALPIEELYKGTDQYGNEKSRWETLLEALPYYLSPGGYGQYKKTTRGLGMFDDDLPVSGSYTDSGKLRFPVDDNLWKKVQAGLFGQYASENARDYFDNERNPLNEKQIQEFVDSGISIQDYWEYREGLSGLKTLAEKADYIYGLDIPTEAKNLFINNLSGRKEEIDLSGMEGFEDFEEYDYAQSNPGKYAVSKAVADDLSEYKQYSKELSAIESDKDEDGKTVSGSRKEKVVKYINDLDLDYGQKIILYRSQYKSDDTYNYEIVDYLNGRDDISYETMVAILKELGFTVKGNTVTWD